MVSMRSCIACRSRESSKGLIHLVLIQDQVTPDLDHRLNGRGAWLHPNCFELARQRRSFNRAFKSGGDLLTRDLEIFLEISFVKGSMITKEQK